MSNRRSSIYVQSYNQVYENHDMPPHEQSCLVNRGICVLTDSIQVAGDRNLRGFDLSIEYDGSLSSAKESRYTLQFAIVPTGLIFADTPLQHDGNNFTTYPISQDTLYVTTLYDAYKNGVKVDNINKALPRNYYLVCYIWQYYDYNVINLTNLSEGYIKIAGRVNISF